MSTTTADPRATWREWLGLALLTIPLFMMATDMTVLFLAIPSVTADLAPSTTQMLWIMHVGEFVAAGLVVTMGRLADKVGRRRLLLLAMVLYGVASGLAASSASPEMLLTARMLIGTATAAASPAAIGLLRSMFADPKQFGVAFAILLGSFSVGGALGPPMGGLLLEHFWWGSVFLVNVPAAALLLIGGRWLLPTVRGDASAGRVDYTSVALSVIGVIAVIYGLQEIADQGLDVVYLAAIVAGLGLGAVFLRRQRRLDDPLLDLSLFSSRALWVSALVLFGATLAMVGVDLVLLQYLQIVAGVPMVHLGLLLAIPGLAAIAGTMAAPVAARYVRPGTVMVLGLVVSLAGVTLIPATIGWLSGSVPWLIAGTTLIAFGSSPVIVLGAQLVVTTAPAHRAGSATAVQDLSTGLGGATSMALIGSASMVAFTRVLRSDAPGDVPDPQLQAAEQSAGGAVAVAESLGGATGGELLEVVRDALSIGTQVAYAVAGLLTVGVIVLVLTGLRGVQLPAGEEDDDGGPDGQRDAAVVETDVATDDEKDPNDADQDSAAAPTAIGDAGP